MNDRLFTVPQKRPMRDWMTVSRSAGLGSSNGVTFFSLGRGTSISRESYDSTAIYVGALGHAVFQVGEPLKETVLERDGILVVPGRTLCGVKTADGAIYTEIIAEKEITMNQILKAGEAVQLKDLISYEEGSIANIDLVSSDTMEFVLMAFDEGTGLTPHRAPGNAIVTALEGSAVIGYEGADYEISAGDSFRFDKNGLHSVTAKGRFKMSLLLVLTEDE